MKPNGIPKVWILLPLAGLILATGCTKSYLLAPIQPTVTPVVTIPTAIPSVTAVNTPLPSPSPIPTSTPSATPMNTWTPTNTATATPTSTPTSTPFPDPWIVDGTSDNFNQEVLQAPLPVLVVFYAPWCPHCQVMEPAAQQFAKDEGGKVKVVMVDIDTQPALSSSYGITGIPTCIFFKNGSETSQQLVGSADTSAEDESVLISLFNQL